MMKKKDWKMPFALILLIMLLGGYYDQLGVEMRTMVLPLGIFIAAGIVIARLKQFEYEMRSARVNARDVIVQNFSIIDSSGDERVYISAASNTPLITIFDKHNIPRVTLDLLDNEPTMKLTGDKGSISIEFDEKGLPNLALKDDTDTIIWSARQQRKSSQNETKE